MVVVELTPTPPVLQGWVKLVPPPHDVRGHVNLQFCFSSMLRALLKKLCLIGVWGKVLVYRNAPAQQNRLGVPVYQSQPEARVRQGDRIFFIKGNMICPRCLPGEADALKSESQGMGSSSKVEEVGSGLKYRLAQHLGS